MRISVGQSRKTKVWTVKELTWQDLLQKLQKPTRTQETAQEYKTLPKAKRDDIKDVGGFVGGVLAGGRRTAETVESRSLITLDLDNIDRGGDVWPLVETCLDWAACLYSTHSHTEANPRVRLIMPLARDVTGEEYEAIARKIAEMIGIDLCDDTTFEASRLMYWPSCPHDAPYVFREQEGPAVDPDEVLALYKDWRDVASWPVSSRREALSKHAAKKQGNPLEKPGVIGAFCACYNIPEAIEKFLPDVYRPTSDPKRYTYQGGSTIGGLVLYQDGLFAYSHHATDPIEGKLVNSFDLVRLHLYRGLDEDSDPGLPVTRLPSYKKMIETAVSDEEVSFYLIKDQIDEDPDPEPEEDWRKQLTLTSKGQLASTINNIVLVLLNDERLKGAYYFDAFKERPCVDGDLPWAKAAERLTDNWTDVDDAGLRQFLELKYNIDNPGKIRDAVDLAMMGRIRHPVREYLEGLTWDGVERVDSVFIDQLSAADTPYTRAVTRAALIGAVARIMHPGCKHDHTLVLIGPQGCGKSTTIARLGREWYTDSLYTMSGKEAYEQLQGYWIIELGEMAAARKSEVEQIKQFISKQSDNYRAAYARRTQEHLRQCAFFGSTNDSDFLRDYTGARRFWPVVVKGGGNGLTAEEVDQIWAEAVAAYKAGEKWHLTKAMEAEAREVQKEHTETSGKLGLIEAFLEKPLPADWQTRTLEERRLYFSGDFDGEDEEVKPRETVCAIEIWCECFYGDPKQYTQSQAREIGNILKSLDGWEYKGGIQAGTIYGRQRGYVRKVEEGLFG